MSPTMIGKENKEAMDFLFRAIEYCKLELGFVSNEAIAEVIVKALPQSDAIEIVEAMQEILNGKYGSQN